jgi:hypothetical protein
MENNEAKIKAKELIDRFYAVNDYSKQGVGCNPYIDKEYAKQCALICCDEIINNDNNLMQTYEQNDFWLQVKQEILNY